MEEQNKTPEEKKKAKVDYVGIIYAAISVYLFGALPGVCGVVLAEVLRRAMSRKHPGILVTVISYVVGAVAALALSVVLTRALASM